MCDLLGMNPTLFRERDEVEAEKCVKNHYVKIQSSQSKEDHQSRICTESFLPRTDSKSNQLEEAPL